MHELSKELGMTSKELLALAQKLGIGASSPSASIEDAQADRIRRRADADGLRREVQPEEATKATKATKSTAATAKATSASDFAARRSDRNDPERRTRTRSPRARVAPVRTRGALDARAGTRRERTRARRRRTQGGAQSRRRAQTRTDAHGVTRWSHDDPSHAARRGWRRRRRRVAPSAAQFLGSSHSAASRAPA